MKENILEKLKTGVIIIDKPQGPSSHQVSAWAGKMLHIQAGHGGTLDPMVSGVLAIMLGRTVKLAPLVLKHDKEYVALMRLHGDVKREDLERIVKEFTGKLYQRPPRQSAVKRALRIRTVYSIEILDVDKRLVLIKVACEAGTYIRSLCHHMGLALGVGAHMQELRRTRSGAFGEESLCTLHELRDACLLADEGDDSALLPLIHPIEKITDILPKVVVRDSAVDALCHGAVLAGVGVLSTTSYKREEPVAVLTEKGELICTGRALKSSEEYRPGDYGLVVAPIAVIMKPGTYPKGWHTSIPA
ncbi:MAG: RNA-guided pseudouridylation complex pseudouridine synthase subunit Cbf5 [Methanogenium sp.]|nr:RNA-guided pseudouridylation complex pseudouridine synthase subunit Cbf5 [Methanogenium sp.]